MSSLGSYLRDLRQRHGVTFEEIARATRVAPRYLEALENDALDALPAPVFARGFVRAYCQVLGEPAEEALALWERQHPGGRPAPTPIGRLGWEVSSERPPGGRGAVLVSFVLLVVLGVALFAVTLGLQSGPETQPMRVTPPAPAADAGPVSPALPLPAPAAAPQPTTPPATTEAPPGAATSPASTSPRPPTRTISQAEVQAALGAVTSPYRLVAHVTEPTWIRVRMADGRTTEETVPGGEVREWVSNAPFTLTVGNAGGVALTLNGRRLPPLGPSGAVISRLVLPPGEP